MSINHILERRLAHAAAEAVPAAAASPLEDAIARAASTLCAAQHPDGHWRYALEADCTIPAEYVLMNHFMGELEPELETRLTNYIRERQLPEGGWPLYPGSGINVSCSVKSYYALKLCGDHPNAEHMRRARRAILAVGGAAASNVFTRIALALFGQIPWRGTPYIPVEHILLPRWFPFHISKIAYWSRTVLVPLAVICSLKPRAANPRGVDIRELFVIPPERESRYFRIRGLLGWAFYVWDRVARLFEPLTPPPLRRLAVERSRDWVLERLERSQGLGGIFPAMVNSYEMLALLGYPSDHPMRRQAREALRELLVLEGDSGYCQPCLSPVWDTALASLALQAAGPDYTSAVRRGLDWLAERQLPEGSPGDWRDNRPDLPGGGWPFEFGNDHYPDLDDTSAVVWAMQSADAQRYRRNIERATAWVRGMQSRCGGFASFDADNTYYYLNAIPFADHGALLDPPTSDVTARCVLLLSYDDTPENRRARAQGLNFLRKEQEGNGSWFGRWGTNYIYGTWSVLTALERAPKREYVQRAVRWLKDVQNDDGGWGESNDTYQVPTTTPEANSHPSSPYQTAWALLGLLAAGEIDSPQVRRGVEYLLRQQQAGGSWCDERFTAPGFPRVFYLRYHGYNVYFPLWALARYQNLLRRS